MTTIPDRSSRRLTINSLANLAGYLIRIVVTLLITPQLLHGLGDSRYGAWSLVESILAYLSLLDLGITASLVRYAARFEAQRDWTSLNKVVNTCFFACLAIGLLVLAITAFLAFGWDRPFGVPADLKDEWKFLLMLLGANYALRLPLAAFTVLLDSRGEYTTKVAIRTAWSLLSSVLLVSLVRAGFGLRAVGVVLTGCGLGESLTMIAASFYFLPALRLSPGFVDRATFRMIRGYSVYALVAMIASRISFQTDAIVIGSFLEPRFIALFMIAARLVEFAKDAMRGLCLPLAPAISALEAQQDLAAIRRLFERGTRILLWFMVPIQAGLLTIGRPFLALWVGADHAWSSYPVLVILSVPLALSVGQGVASRMLYGIGRLRFFAAVLMAEALINLGLSVALVRGFDILGVALGTAIPNVVANVVVIAYACRVLGVSLHEHARSVWLGPLLCGTVLGVFWMAAAPLVTNWAGFVALGVAGTAGYALPALLCEVGLKGLAGSLHQALPRRWGASTGSRARPDCMAGGEPVSR